MYGMDGLGLTTFNLKKIFSC